MRAWSNNRKRAKRNERRKRRENGNIIFG